MYWMWPWAAALTGAGLAALLVVVAWHGACRRRKLLSGWCGTDGAACVLHSSARRKLRHGLLAAALGLVVVALARPQGAAVVAGAELRATVLLVLDLSASMRVTDVLPSRGEAGRQWLEALAQQLPAARLGLIGFAGEAEVLCPPTEDQALVVELLRHLPTDLALREGSELRPALALARAVLERGGGGSLVLVTDGEHHDPDPVAALAGTRGLDLIVVTLGGSTPAPIPPAAGGPVVLDPRAGRPALSAAQPETMHALARAIGGLALVGDAPGAGVAEAVRRLGMHAAGLAPGGAAFRRRELAPWFLAGALVLLVARLGLSERPALRSRRVTFSGALSTGAASVLVLCAGAVGLGLRAANDVPPRDADSIQSARAASLRAPGHDRHRCLYNLALALQQSGAAEEAGRIYVQTLARPGCPRIVRASCLNNLGALDLEQAHRMAEKDPTAAREALSAALDSLREANRLEPELEATGRNLHAATALWTEVQSLCLLAELSRNRPALPTGQPPTQRPAGEATPPRAAALAAARAPSPRANFGAARAAAVDGDVLERLGAGAGTSRDVLRLLYGRSSTALPPARLPW
jgi:Ca-activated chloride channel family protein